MIVGVNISNNFELWLSEAVHEFVSRELLGPSAIEQQKYVTTKMVHAQEAVTLPTVTKWRKTFQ
jgi:hypothetical protein